MLELLISGTIEKWLRCCISFLGAGEKVQAGWGREGREESEAEQWEERKRRYVLNLFLAPIQRKPVYI
jgi:hypothetical protein